MACRRRDLLHTLPRSQRGTESLVGGRQVDPCPVWGAHRCCHARQTPCRPEGGTWRWQGSLVHGFEPPLPFRRASSLCSQVIQSVLPASGLLRTSARRFRDVRPARSRLPRVECEREVRVLRRVTRLHGAGLVAVVEEADRTGTLDLVAPHGKSVAVPAAGLRDLMRAAAPRMPHDASKRAPRTLCKCSTMLQALEGAGAAASFVAEDEATRRGRRA